MKSLSLFSWEYIMPSEAQKRASAKYRKEKVAQRVVRFSPTDQDLLDWLDAQPNRMGYIKELIRADMEGRVSRG